MKKILLLILSLIYVTTIGRSQSYAHQYFDGNDTIPWQSIFVNIDTASTNIWQIGKPQKIIFDTSATQPNAILTDTINYIPNDNISRFQLEVESYSNWGIYAFQWKQKLDLDTNLDGGIIEYSIDKGASWVNVFGDPYVYNFYGYDAANEGVAHTSELAFTGTDSSWKDIWLCFDWSWVSTIEDTLLLRFTLKTDSIDNSKEGWMIDNMIFHLTTFHTIAESPQRNYIEVYPNPTADILHIQTQKMQEFHIIEKMELINSKGQVVDEWENIPTKFFIHTQKYQNGNYFLKVKTNIKTETINVIINH